MSYDEHLISMAGGDGDVLDQIQKRADAATEGPWVEWHENGTPGQLEAYNCPPATGAFLIDYADWEQKQKDANFIAHARTDIPALLAMVRERDAKLAAVQQIVDTFEHYGIAVGTEVLRAALTATEGAA